MERIPCFASPAARVRPTGPAPRSSLGNLRLAELNSHALEALKRQEGHRRSTSTSVGSDCVSSPKAAEILRQHPSQAYSESSTLLPERTAISRAGWNLSACLAGSAGSLWNRDRGCCVPPPIRLSKHPANRRKRRMPIAEMTLVRRPPSR